MKKIIAISIGLGVLGILSTSLAATEAIIGDNCNIAAYPYNPTAEPLYSEGGANNEVNFLTANDTVSQTSCRGRVPYDQQHTQFNLGGLYADDMGLDSEVQVPRATHIHNYVNDMKQDDNYYYRSFIYAFDIELEKDTLENTKMENIGNAVPEGFNLTCTTPSNTATPELHKCNGYNASAYGGTKVTIYEHPDRWTIRWSFGVNSAGEYEGARLANVPARWGNNTDLNTVLRDYLISKGLNPGNINLADQNSLYRKFDPEVTITSKDKTTAAEGNKSIWTATTTSRVDVINFAIAKNRLQALNNGTIDYQTFFEKYCTASDNGKNYIYENNAWQECTGYQYWTPIDSVSSSGLTLPDAYQNDTTINYKNSSGQTLHFNKAFWIAIGSVASVWKAPSSQTSTLACADLQWDGAFKKPGLMGIYMADTVNPNALLPDEKAIMKFKTIYQTGTGTQRPLEYRWTAFYGDQNRPAWFTNNDSLYGGIMEVGEQILQPMFQSSLPVRLLRIAHAAPASAQPLSDSVYADNTLPSATTNQLAALIKIGDFKDEISATLSGNPLTDNDNQVFYSSGSEGVTVGVQAFYADGKNIPGDGPVVSTPDGVKQKANPCHLELVIQPKPVTCIDLDIFPKTLAPNTPVTFTVTPKFNPSNQSLPLNYRWQAKPYQVLTPGFADALDISDVSAIPGVLNTDDNSPTWMGVGMIDAVNGASSGLQSVFCPGGNCEQQTYVPVDPSGPVVNPVDEYLQDSYNQFNTFEEFNAQEEFNSTEMMGANIFADFGKAAVLAENESYSDSINFNSAGNFSPSDFAVPLALSYGGFKDTESSPGLGANPFLETTDNNTYYTGGPANTLIKVQAEGKDGTLYPPCNENLIIPQGAICELLKVKFLAGGTEVAKEDLTADVSYQIEVDKANSVREDGTPIEKYAVLVMNPAGVGTLNPAPGNTNCAAIKKTVTGDQDYGTDVTVANYTETSTSVNCKYIYVPKAGDKITMLADPHDNVAACRIDQTIPGAPDNLCELLKVKFFDQDTEVQKNNMVAGTPYRVEIDQANSVRTDGTPISKYTVVAYNPAGVGTMTAAPGNAASCTAVSDIPVIDPGAEVKARGTQTSTAVSCKYLYTPNAGDKITLLADPHDNVAACRVDQVIPGRTEPICKDLNLQTSPALSGNQIAQGQLVAFAVNPVDTENKPRSPIVYSETGNGNFVANPNNAPVPDCPAVPASGTFEASKSCRYSYQAPNDGTEARVTIKVKQDDGVPECLEEFIVKPTAKEICLALNLRVNGQYTLNPQIVPNQSYVLQVDPVTTQGHAIQMVEWTETGDGQLIGAPSNPGICPAIINNGAVSTLSICRYIFSSGKNAQDVGFSVHAVPDDNVAACKANAAGYKPPVVPPYCLYLDLDYIPEPFQTAYPSNMNATVVMSDGSPYSSQPGGLNRVRFTATNGVGNFSGGFGNTTGSNTADFLTPTEINGNTRNVNYQNGNANSGINVYLADTDVRMSASCMRQLRPVPVFTPPCTIPPTIEHKDGNRYCAEDGDSESYCWTIDGPNNDLLFTNGKNTATGDCVELDESYERFELLVEDCNPEYKDYCFDTLTNDETPETPTIEKRISKASPLRFTTAVHFSTTGVTGAAPQTETVQYKVEYIPANFETEDGRTMTARIYDPAFSGEIRGLKINVDGTKSTPGGKISFKVPSAFQITSPSGYSLCTNSNSDNDKCFRIEGAGPENSYMEISGIDSDEPIIIEYTGTLTSGITIDDCRSGEWCNEEFRNQSRVDDLQYCVETADSEGDITVVCTPIDTPEITSNTVLADVVCSYFLTRASGDVFLEDELTYGIDVSKCYPFKNVSSTIVKPIPPIEGGLASTGTPIVVSINHEICSAGQTEIPFANLPEAQQTELKKLFGSEISTLSSQICEVGLVPGSDWDKTNIAAAMTQNIGKLTRWSSLVNPTNAITDFTVLSQNSLGGVYYYNGNGETVTIDGLQIPEGSGALTIIVENANLQINGNIEYIAGTEPQNAEEIASLGVIVLDGNVKIDKEVEKLAGAYFVQRTTPDNYGVGNLFSIDKTNPSDTTSNMVDSPKQLTVNGSIYGNIGPLFMHRISSGDITKDEGSITIRYDQRIIQNPPAGLTDLLGTFSQTQIAQ